MKKKLAIGFGIALCMLLCACGAPKGLTDQEMYVYYLNADKNALRQDAYPRKDIKDAIEKLEMHGVFESTKPLKNWENEKNTVTLYFGSDYYQMEAGNEVLTRAAIVKTLTQIEGIEFVLFYVEGEPLRDQSGREIGAMRAEDFVQNTGSSIDSYQTVDLTLYYADKEGTCLKEKKVSNVHYNVNTPIERVVVEQLMKGISTDEYQSTIPKTAMLLGVSVKEDICYVNFDSKFVSDGTELAPELIVYSIVHSIIENSSVTKVQILIDGSSEVVYKNSVDLAVPLKANKKYLEEK